MNYGNPSFLHFLKSLLRPARIGLIFAFAILWGGKQSFAQQATLSAGAKLLFDSEHTTYYTKLKLNPAEQEAIYKKLQLRLSKDKKELHAITDNTLESPLNPTVSIIDLNNDGQPEVIVNLYNLFWTGQGGQETIFGKNKAGSMIEIGDAQGVTEILPTGANGYPDLLVGGPGMTAPVLRWNGTKYKFFKEVDFGQYTAPKTMSYEAYYKKQKIK